MPELPEVETLVRQLNQEAKGRKIVDVFFFEKKFLKNVSPLQFEKTIKGAQIENVKRVGKNILIYLNNNFVVLIHLKLTGHLLIGKYELVNNQLVPKEEILKDPINQFLRFALKLDDGRYLVLSDLRKFAKILLLKKEEVEAEIQSIGYDPLEKNFSLKVFKNLLKDKRGIIKKFLMDQKYISGIGNIYASEILFDAKISPFRKINSLKEEEIKTLYESIKKILKKAIKHQGTSAKDESYRNLYGKKGSYGQFLKVYQREGQKCFRCQHKIKRIKLDNRSTFYCPFCQK